MSFSVSWKRSSSVFSLAAMTILLTDEPPKRPVRLLVPNDRRPASWLGGPPRAGQKEKGSLRGLVVLVFAFALWRTFLLRLLRGLAGQLPWLVRFAASLLIFI